MMDDVLFVLLGGLIAIGLVLLRRRFAGFHGQSPADYEDTYPPVDLRTHLKGEMICEGVIFGPLGRMTSTFAADFNITWDGDKGVMDEVFTYNDGSTQVRQWRITLQSEGAFFLEADDVPGRGEGVIRGGAVQMRYPIKLPESAGGHVLNCMDWMYLAPDGAIMNRSQFRKFGIKVAELIAVIRPKGDA